MGPLSCFAIFSAAVDFVYTDSFSMNTKDFMLVEEMPWVFSMAIPVSLCMEAKTNLKSGSRLMIN